ncbi:D-alanine--D-alanine ligase [bacterium]|nr:MAG: D-alanine--D-alanine ligase [bacterium]
MNVAVLMGGTSSEVEVSRKSGKAIARGLTERGHNVHLFDWEEERLITDIDTIRRFDVVFIAYHGGAGEDGRVQAILDVAGMKYTGSDYVASALGMNKTLSRSIFSRNGIPIPPGIIVNTDFPPEKLLIIMAKEGFGLPAVVKPATQGSTIGVTIAISEKEFLEGVNKAFRYSDKIIIEKYIPGKEVTVSVLGGLPLPVIEIIPQDGFYDYEHKYSKGKSEYVCPADIPAITFEKLKNIGARAYNAIGCRHYARVDFRLSDSGNIYCLEVNTLPGMTDLSLVPMAARAVGIEFPELVHKIACMAYEGRNE